MYIKVRNATMLTSKELRVLGFGFIHFYLFFTFFRKIFFVLNPLSCYASEKAPRSVVRYILSFRLSLEVR